MRNEKLDIFRGLAMIWVIFNHTIYWLSFFAYPEWQGITRSYFLIGTQLFFFIAGASNGMSSKKSILKFYLLRFKRILVPYWIYAAICILFTIITTNIDIFFYLKKAFYSWIIFEGRTGYSRLTWAIWFVPVYLLVMLLFPFFRIFYEKFISSKIKIIPLVFFAFVLFLLQFFPNNKNELLDYSLKVTFYSFFTYLGLFFTEIFKKRKILISAILAFLCIIATVLSILFLNQSPNMQANKFPPNFIFLLYSLGFLAILYIFSDAIVRVIKTFKKNKIFNWIYTQYVKHGVTIFLFHPFVFLLLIWLKKTCFANINEIISFTIILFLSITLSSVIGKVFSWVELIKIRKKKNQE